MNAMIRVCTVWMMLATGGAHAATYYVATDGRPESDGSAAKPWPSVEYALSKVGGGHTIVLKPGVYRGPIEIPKQYAGTEARPTVIQSEVKWKAVILGAPYHVISNADGCDWVTIDGFEVMGGRYDGVKLNGDHNVVRHCWVHNNKAMGIAMHNQKDGTIEDNLIEFNGGHVQFDHGVYADGDGLSVRGNVVRHNASYGLHLYPSIQNSRVENNLVYGQVRRRGIIVASPKGGGENVVVNNTVVEGQPLTLWIGKGSPEHAPPTDFCGRQRPRDKAPDLGAFAFEPILTGEQARTGWDNGWAYHRHGNQAGLPDPWVLPPSEPAKRAQ